MVDRVSFDSFSVSLPKEIEKKKESFLELIKDYLKKVNEDQKMADKAIEDFLKGKGELHRTILMVEKADISFRLFMKIRNKLIEAYEEIMRMQI